MCLLAGTCGCACVRMCERECACAHGCVLAYARATCAAAPIGSLCRLRSTPESVYVASPTVAVVSVVIADTTHFCQGMKAPLPAEAALAPRGAGRKVGRAVAGRRNGPIVAQALFAVLQPVLDQ